MRCLVSSVIARVIVLSDSTQLLCNGARGYHGASGWGVCATKKTATGTLEVIAELHHLLSYKPQCHDTTVVAFGSAWRCRRAVSVRTGNEYIVRAIQCCIRMLGFGGTGFRVSF